MKKRDKNLSVLKHAMYQEKGKGKKEVVRVLNEDEAEYLSKFFTLIPYLYKIRVQFMPGFNPKFSAVPGIVRSLYYEKRKNHKGTVVKRLNKKELAQCEEYFEVRPYKYKVKLRA